MNGIQDELVAELFAMAAEGLEVRFRPAGSGMPGCVEIRIEGRLGEERAAVSFIMDPEVHGPPLLFQLRRRREEWLTLAVESMGTKRAGQLPTHAAGSFAALREPKMRDWIMTRLRESLRDLARHSPYVTNEMGEFARRMEETSIALGCWRPAIEFLRDAQGDAGYPLGYI